MIEVLHTVTEGSSVTPHIGQSRHCSILESKIAALLVGESYVMQDLRKDIIKRSPWSGIKTIFGESGTGKELIAEAIHIASGLKGAYIRLNCSNLTTDLALSELFGHEKGAFTSADSRRIGAFERADGGTLLLDEFGNLPMEVQGQLLRVLEDGSFPRVGGNSEICPEVNVVIATNENLKKAVEEKRLKEDLFNRIAGLPFLSPPLRDHMEDIPALIKTFLARKSEEIKKHTGTSKVEISEGAYSLFSSYEWPGNVRQLLKVFESCLQIMDTSEKNYITLANVERIFRAVGIQAQIKLGDSTTSLQQRSYTDLELLPSLLARGETHAERLQQIEGILIRYALESNDTQIKAAEVLGMNRTTLFKKLKQLESKT